MTPDLARRIEAAVKILNDPDRGVSEELVAGIVGCVLPELFTDPPSMWLAPWRATEAMSKKPEEWFADAAIWAEMRDAHLVSQKASP